MHVLFTKQELEWVNTKAVGFPIKEGCPYSIRNSIEKKKHLINNQNLEDAIYAGSNRKG